MAATVVIHEQNGTSPGSGTSGISNANFGSSDAPNLVAATYPVAKGGSSYEKWLRLDVTNMGGSTKIDNLRVWAPGATFPIGTGTYVKTSCATGGGYPAIVAYVTPVATTSSKAVVTMLTAEPAANLGIAGSLSGSLTAIGKSDFAVFQAQIGAADNAGSNVTLRFKWDEVA